VAGATQRRRERLRAETTEEITETALALLTEGGPDAVTLRAIAREMGMTAGAIYGYFPTRDDLINRLITDVYTSLVDAVEAARDACPPDDAGGRIVAWGRALREWSVANPAGFRLIYGDGVPGYRPREGGVAVEPAHRACMGLTQLVASVWQRAAPHQPAADWADFADGLVAEVRREFPDLPAAAIALALRLWGRMHGLVALEVYGHLRGQTTDPATLYEAELHDVVRSLGC
jgi:AcrR family transcriptional regulator